MKKVVFFSTIIVLIDQIIKFIVRTKMDLLNSIVIIPKFFKLTYARNTGAAFSIFDNSPLLIVIISIMALYFVYKYVLENKSFKISSVLLLGGIVANLIDRIFLGYVVDYLDFNIFGYDFPIFNLADICIVIGCLIITINIIREKEV